MTSSKYHLELTGSTNEGPAQTVVGRFLVLETRRDGTVRPIERRCLDPYPSDDEAHDAAQVAGKAFIAEMERRASA